MTGLTLKCPKCRKRMAIRSSQSMTETTTEAFLYCFDCGIKAKAFAEVKEIEIAEYKPLVLTGGTINKIHRTSS